MTKDISSLEAEGREAYRRKVMRFHNPYNRGTLEFAAWMRGWNKERSNV